MATRNIIITGAAGHLAGVIINKLNSPEYNIRGLILPKEKGPKQENAQYFIGDITNVHTLEPLFDGLNPNETVVIHAAALISIQDKVSPVVYNVNVNGTKHVVDACIEHGVKRLVYVSSVHALAEPDKVSMIYETKEFDPETVEGAYAKTKAEATQYVLEAVGKGLDVVVVHPSGVVGPYDKGRNHIVQLVQMYLRGKLPAGVTGGFDFVDVRDVADGIISAMEKGRSGETYILSNRWVSIPELLEFMRLGAHRKHRKGCVPLWMAKSVAPVFEWIGKVTHTRPVFTKYSLATMEMNGHYCHDKATMELGYHPRDMKDTIRDTMNWLIAMQAI